MINSSDVFVIKGFTVCKLFLLKPNFLLSFISTPFNLKQTLKGNVDNSLEIHPFYGKAKFEDENDKKL